MKEIWENIPSYEGYYQVSNLGNFRSIPRIVKYKNERTRCYPGKVLSTEQTKDNYRRIVLSKNGIRTRYMCHRLIALTFIPNLKNKPFINHIDGDKNNNKVINLEWCNASENIIHADNTGLRNMFEHHHPSNAKRIKCLETNKIFSSYYRAIKWLGKTPNSISALVRGTKIYGKAFGYHWEFIN